MAHGARSVRNAALPMSCRDETASLWRRRVLGLMTTSGLRYGRASWRRRTWKYCAGVVQFTTMRLGCSDLSALSAHEQTAQLRQGRR